MPNENNIECFKGNILDKESRNPLPPQDGTVVNLAYLESMTGKSSGPRFSRTLMEEKRSSLNDGRYKPVILTFTGHYLPGYKAYGILRNTVNTVENLYEEMEFWIVTRDRDLGDDKPYDDIQTDKWLPLDNCNVYYLSSRACTAKSISEVVSGTRHDVVYLTSFFDPLTIKVLLLRRLRKIPLKPVIVEPSGEFGWASLKQKFLKKIAFICAARFFGLYKDVTWRATSEHEQIDIIKYMRIRPASIHIATFLPEKIVQCSNVSKKSVIRHDNAKYELRLIYLSRISPEKNLDYALKILGKINSNVVFDIYGPNENARYWNECRELTKQLPANVKVNYFGPLEHSEVHKVFGLYDMFLFPTGGENYGFVIAESLIAGTPVLTSDNTPWRNLQSDDLGWDFALDDMDSFVAVIEQHAKTTPNERTKIRQKIKTFAAKRLSDPAVLEANRRLFLDRIVR